MFRGPWAKESILCRGDDRQCEAQNAVWAIGNAFARLKRHVRSDRGAVMAAAVRLAGVVIDRYARAQYGVSEAGQFDAVFS
jgi:hypothetical protein